MKNLTIIQCSIFPEPNIPVFQDSNIPIVSEANQLVITRDILRIPNHRRLSDK